MSADLLVSTDFYILDQSFNKVFALTQYESLMWVDKYDEPGSIEIYAPPTEEIKKYAVIGNYIQSSRSEHIMVIEKLTTTFSSQNGERLVIAGRSLESILDRRVIFMTLYLTNKIHPTDEEGVDNLEDAIKRILDATFIDPENDDRKVSNLIFEYSNSPVYLTDSSGRNVYDSNSDTILGDYIGDDDISDIEVDNMEFDKGENVLNIINTIVKSKGLGYKITLNSSNQLVFKLINGKDRTADQTDYPLVEFSPTFNNIKDTKYVVDGGESYKNYIYTEGEVYKNTAPKIIETGDATGLDRREYYIQSDSTHETESTITTHDGLINEKTKLSETEYENVLKEEGEKSFNAYAIRSSMESEVEPRLQFVYGRDFYIGDILQIKDKSGNTGNARCIEFIISHTTSGYEEYPTFEDVNDEEQSPSQTTASGSEYSSEGKNSNTVFQALMAMMPVGYIYHTTDPEDPATKFGFGTWIQHSGYFLRGADGKTNVVTANQASNDGGSDIVSLAITNLASHNHTQNSHNHTQNAHRHALPWRPGWGSVRGSKDWADNCYHEASSYANGTTATNVATTATNQNNGSGTAFSVLNSYKNVYIWERIS